MEHIQKHEWVQTYPYESITQCRYCNFRKYQVSGGTFMQPRIIYIKKDMASFEEPVCITRTINAPQREADK